MKKKSNITEGDSHSSDSLKENHNSLCNKNPSNKSKYQEEKSLNLERKQRHLECIENIKKTKQEKLAKRLRENMIRRKTDL